MRAHEYADTHEGVRGISVLYGRAKGLAEGMWLFLFRLAAVVDAPAFSVAGMTTSHVGGKPACGVRWPLQQGGLVGV